MNIHDQIITAQDAVRRDGHENMNVYLGYKQRRELEDHAKELIAASSGMRYEDPQPYYCGQPIFYVEDEDHLNCAAIP